MSVVVRVDHPFLGASTGCMSKSLAVLNGTWRQLEGEGGTRSRAQGCHESNRKKKTDSAPLPQESPLGVSSSADSALEQRETFNVLFCDSPSRKAEKQRGVSTIPCQSGTCTHNWKVTTTDDDHDDRLGGVPSLVHVILPPVTVPYIRYTTPHTLHIKNRPRRGVWLSMILSVNVTIFIGHPARTSKSGTHGSERPIDPIAASTLIVTA